MYYCYLKTPIGELLLAGDADGLAKVCFPEESARCTPAKNWIFDDKAFASVRRQLTEYFAGKRETFDVELKCVGTEFQLMVLSELQKIPYGTTCSYSDVAKRIGRPKAVRAVGRANALNSIPIIIPCHRVIGASGKLTGYSGGRLVKEMLLRLETESRS